MSKGTPSPCEVEILKALEISELHYTDIKAKIVNPRTKKPFTDRAISFSQRRLLDAGMIDHSQGSGHRPYRITEKGKDVLNRLRLEESARRSQLQGVYKAKEIVFKMDAEELLWMIRGESPVIFNYLVQVENQVCPIPTVATFCGSKEIKAMILTDPYHTADESSELLLEETLSPLKNHLLPVIFQNCENIVLRQRETGKKPKLDLASVLDFDWIVSLRVDGKETVKRLSHSTDAETTKLRDEIEERLVGLILLNIAYTWKPGYELLIPSLIEGGLLDPQEGKELQDLYVGYHGDNKQHSSEMLEKMQERMLPQALLHLKNGNGLRFPKGSDEDKIFAEIASGIRESIDKARKK